MAPLVVMLAVWVLVRAIGFAGVWDQADSGSGALRFAFAAMFVFTAMSHFHPRSRPDSATPRPDSAAAVSRAALPGVAAGLRAELRVRVLFERRARAVGARHVCRVRRDAERRVRAADAQEKMSYPNQFWGLDASRSGITHR